APEPAVLGERPPGLAHEPHGHPLVGFAAAGRQERGVGGRAHGDTVPSALRSTPGRSAPGRSASLAACDVRSTTTRSTPRTTRRATRTTSSRPSRGPSPSATTTTTP